MYEERISEKKVQRNRLRLPFDNVFELLRYYSNERGISIGIIEELQKLQRCRRYTVTTCNATAFRFIQLLTTDSNCA